MQCLRPQKGQPGQEELVSKAHLQDQLQNSATLPSCNGDGKFDDADVPHTQPEVPPAEGVSKTAALASPEEMSAYPDGAAAAALQGTADNKSAQEEADQPRTDCATIAGVPAHLEDVLAVPSKATRPAAATDLAAPGTAKPRQAVRSNATANSLNETDGDLEPGAAGSGSAGDETEDGASDLSDSGLDCTSTPVAIGLDPFAGFRHATAKHGEGPQFQYGSLAKSLGDEDSR